MKDLTQPIKWHGGKFYVAKKILERDLVPRHLHYVEPYFGGGALLLTRDPNDERLWWPKHKGVSEVINDIHGELINFWRVLQDVETFERFRRRVEAIPLARDEWTKGHDHSPTGDPVDDAVAFFVDARQSRAGQMEGFTPLTRTRTRRHMNGNVSEWIGAVDGLAAVHARLRRVVIENMPAIQLIGREDTDSTFFYCDPPYLHETRRSPKAYKHEMNQSDHLQLLEVLRNCRGKVMLSGYPSSVYDDGLPGWHRVEIELSNHAAGGETKRRETEVLWMNYPPR